MENIISELIKMVNMASPILWEAARQSVMASLVKSILSAIVLTTTGVTLGYAAMRITESELFNEDASCGTMNDTELIGIGVILMIIVSAILIVMALVSINDAIGYAVAPDYHAIQNLIKLLPGSYR